MSSKPLELEVREDEAETRRAVRFMCDLRKTQMAYLFVSICFAIESMPIYVRKIRSEGDLKLIMWQRPNRNGKREKKGERNPMQLLHGKTTY
jgi:hypothetical protein